MSKNHGWLKFLVGAGIGVGVGVLLAPKSGKETRKELHEKIDALMAKVKKMDKDDVKELITNKIEEIKTDLANLDAETVSETIKKEAKKIKAKTEDLVAIAVQKGTPVVAKAAEEFKASTIKVLENITARLKDEETKKPVSKTKSKAKN